MTSAALPVTRAGATSEAKTAPGMWRSQAAAKPSRGSRLASSKPPALTAKVTSAMPRMAIRASGLVSMAQPFRQGTSQTADNAADQDIPAAGDQPRRDDGRERRHDPGHEITASLPHAEQQREEGGGEGEVEPISGGVVDGRAQ